MYLAAKLFKMLPDNYRLVLSLHLYMLKLLSQLLISTLFFFLVEWEENILYKKYFTVRMLKEKLYLNQ